MSYHDDRVRLPPLREALSRGDQHGGDGENGQSSLTLPPIKSGLRQAKSYACLLEVLPSASESTHRSRLTPSASARDLLRSEIMQPTAFARMSPLPDPSSPHRRSSSTSQADNTASLGHPSFDHSQAPTARDYPIDASILDNGSYFNNSLASSTIPYNVAYVRPSDTMLTPMQPRPSYPTSGLLQPPALASESSDLMPVTMQSYSSYPSYSSSGLIQSPTMATRLSHLSLTTPPLYDGLAADMESSHLDNTEFGLYSRGLAASDTQSFLYEPALVPCSADNFTLHGFATGSPQPPANVARGYSSLYSDELSFIGQSTSVSSDNAFGSVLLPASSLSVAASGARSSIPLSIPSTSNIYTGQRPNVTPGNTFSSLLLPEPSLNVDSIGAKPLTPLNLPSTGNRSIRHIPRASSGITVSSLLLPNLPRNFGSFTSAGPLAPLDFPATRNSSSVANYLPASTSSSAQDSRHQRNTLSFNASSHRARRYPPLPPPGTLENLISNSGMLQSSILLPSIGTSAPDVIQRGSSLSRYVCEACGRGFSRPSGLATHMLSHTGDRPFRCQICGKTFSVASNLRRHVKIHEYLDTEDQHDHCE